MAGADLDAMLPALMGTWPEFPEASKRTILQVAQSGMQERSQRA